MSTVQTGEARPQAAALAMLVARIERLPLSWWHIRSRLIIGTATFFDAYSLMAIAYALPVLVRQWHLTPKAVGLVISAGFFGQLFGALIFGWLAERIGRLRVTQVSVVIFALMSLCCAWSWGMTSLAVFRFLQGLGVGGEVPVASAYINEFAGSKSRGRFFVLYELAFSLGLILAGTLGWWLVPSLGWQMVFYIGTLPAVGAIFLRRMLPESPRWLATHGRMAEAETIVAEMETAIARSGKTLTEPVPRPFVAPKRGVPILKEMLSGRYLRRSVLLWVLWISSYLVYYGLFTWLPTMYTSVFHVPLQRALAWGVISQVFSLVGSLFCAWLIDRMGRRRWYIMAYLCGASPLLLLAYMGAQSGFQVWLTVSFSYLFLGSINLSLYLYTAEMYPTRMRAFAASVASAWMRLASTLGPSVVGFMLVHSGTRWVFLMFALVAATGGVAMLLFSTETTGRVLEEISP
jgi:putative MFS transporter